MSTIVYQCPSCGAPLAYGTESKKLECEACGNSYELDALETMNESSEHSSIHFDMPKETFGTQESEQMRSYICQACGAELLAQETTMATECPYCSSPTILPERIDGGVKPELVIPFSVTREQAQQQFEAYFKGKKLLPNVFLDSRNRIAEMRKLYVPYWLFDCTAGGRVVYNAKKEYIRREGEWEVAYTEHYVLNRAGTMEFTGIPVDGSVKLDNRITESLEPYDLSAAVPFEPAVLAGAMSDHADADSSDCEQRARQRVENSMEQLLRSTVSGYTSVSVRSRNFFAESSRVRPVLMPVWMITTEKDGTTYTFAINGQTGKLTCDVPADKGKSLIWGVGVSAGVFALVCAMFFAAGMLADGTLLIAVFAALAAGLGTVASLTGQLKQAASVHAAGSYSDSHSFRLTGNRDFYLHTTQVRRRIQQSSQQMRMQSMPHAPQRSMGNPAMHGTAQHMPHMPMHGPAQHMPHKPVHRPVQSIPRRPMRGPVQRPMGGMVKQPPQRSSRGLEPRHLQGPGRRPPRSGRF